MYDDPRYHESAYFASGEELPRSPELKIYRRGLKDLARLGRRGKLLDVGCARGVFLNLARKDGWSVTGVELSDKHAAYARAQYGIDVWSGDFLEAPFNDGTFATITMWDFLEHVLDPRAVLSFARKLLAADGLLLVFTIDSASLFNVIGDIVDRATFSRMRRPLELLYDARHNFYFNRTALERVLLESGFTVERWRADRAYIGRWLSEPAPRYLKAGGFVVDFASVALGRPYRRTAISRR